MFQLFVILAIVAAVLLTFIVLIQESKGGGLASDFSNMNALAGVRRTTDLVEKLTWSLAAILVVCSIVTAKCHVDGENQTGTENIENVKAQAPASNAAAPAQQSAGQQSAGQAQPAGQPQ